MRHWMRVLNRSFNQPTISAKCKTDYFSLNYSHLKFVFKICLFGCIIQTIVFIIEYYSQF